MPSPESEVMKNIYADLVAIFMANPSVAGDIKARRLIMEGLHKSCSEPTDVTYEEINNAGTCHGLWCKPLNASKDHVILYTHGGGFATNDSHSHRKMTGHIAKAAGVPVLSIDYRLAPEHSFPAQIEDAVEAYRWLLKQGYKPSQVATAGDSAGGNLALALVLKLRDLGDKQLPAAIVGLSPWVDMEVNGPTLESNKATDPLIHTELLQPMVNMYLGEEGKPTDPLANPLYADFKGLPPMYIVVGTHETLQDNGERLAEKAREAGLDVVLERGVGMQHVYTAMAGTAKEADDTIANIGRWLKGKLKV